VTEPELREPDLPRTAKVRGRALRTGWTTGACAAAAAKAATMALDTGQPTRNVEIGLPSGRRVKFPVDTCTLSPQHAPGAAQSAPAAGASVDPAVPDDAARVAEAVVIKDAGDDPDVTHGARLTATVSWRDIPGIELDGGVGVGVVTKPGLGLEPGAPAINPVPRQMITESVAEVVDLSARGVRVIISVPDGERMARKTTNARLGIIGGISILGTTGIVRPFSTASWRASVEQAISVLAAQGESTLVLCTGGRTEKGAMALRPGLPEICFVEVGDFTGAALRRAVARGLTTVVFVGMAGKLTKLASGVLMTHYTKSKVSTDLLSDITRSAGGSDALAASVATANTARHAVEQWEAAGILETAGHELCSRAATVLSRFCAEVATELTQPAPPQDAAAARPPGTQAAAPVVPSIQVVMVDFTGRKQIAASPELPAPQSALPEVPESPEDHP
jgi:cobalt-precorrin-5B (C1)-methyltransferase